MTSVRIENMSTEDLLSSSRRLKDNRRDLNNKQRNVGAEITKLEHALKEKNDAMSKISGRIKENAAAQEFVDAELAHRGCYRSLGRS